MKYYTAEKPLDDVVADDVADDVVDDVADDVEDDVADDVAQLPVNTHTRWLDVANCKCYLPEFFNTFYNNLLI